MIVPKPPRAPVLAVFAGTFDPLTCGHEDLVRRAAPLFDGLVIGVAVAHHKKTLFTLDERLALVRATLADLATVQVVPFAGLLTDLMRQHGARVVVRGVRSATDYDYETQLAGMNRRLLPGMETLLMQPGDAWAHVSSTLVREIAQLGGAVAEWVPAVVLPALLQKVGRAPTKDQS